MPRLRATAGGMRGIWPAIYAVVAGTAGLAVMAAAGAPRTALVIQTAALAVGGVIAGFLARGRRPIPNAFVLPGLALGAVLIGLPLLVGPDVEGVRRWLQAGPLLIQPAMIVRPPMVWLYARRDALWVGRGLAMIAAGLLALRPDQAGVLQIYISMLLRWARAFAYAPELAISAQSYPALCAIAAACEARPATIRAAAANGLSGRFFTDPEG